VRLALWDRLREGDKVIKDGLVYTVTGVCLAAGCEPNLVMLSAPYTPQYQTQTYNCYECATIDVDRLLDEIEAMYEEYTPAPEPKPSVRMIELRIPQPGDELPFTVYDNGNGGGLRYNLTGSFTIGCKEGWLVCTDAAIALGLPQGVCTGRVVAQVKEEQS
jgi:hypothetical protein